MVRIAIIGGSGEFGRLFARIFAEEGHEVLITGRDEAKGERVAREIGVRFSRDNVAAARWGDVVIISVYIDNTVEVIRQVAPHVREGALLMDVTSVKVEPCRAMLEHARRGVEIVGTHPMFGPRVKSLEGQVFVLTPLRGERWKRWLLEWLERHRARVIVTTPEEHDRIMSVVQCLTHFTYISVASTLQELGVDVKYSRRFASPIYELMLDLIARIVGQNPHLYASIQMHNPLATKVHDTFIAQASRLRDIVAAQDKRAFVELMAKAARHMGDVEAAMGRSDKAIHALSEELKKLRESLGKEVALRHLYSGAVHIGVVKEVTPERVTLISGRKEVSLKIANVELLSEEELLRHKAERLPKQRRDFSVLLPESAEEELIASLLRSTVRGVLSCEVIDIYRGRQIPEQMKSVTFRVVGVDVDFSAVERFLKGIGGRLR
ncbi:MAG: prephenate dehydrogenase [Euryarchaeota archaeon]|nr:prephenate dehydrogenase [Euryarchaeota archaeon]